MPTTIQEYQNLTDSEKIGLLSKIQYIITMLARGTYTVESEEVDCPKELRKFNELTHRIACQQMDICFKKEYIPDNIFVQMIIEDMVSMGIYNDVDLELTRLSSTL